MKKKKKTNKECKKCGLLESTVESMDFKGCAIYDSKKGVAHNFDYHAKS